MKLTEIIQVDYSKELSELCHKAKNLYNSGLWYYRQDFFNLGNFLSYYDLDFMLKHKEVYKQLPAQTSQQILKLIINPRPTTAHQKVQKGFDKLTKIPPIKLFPLKFLEFS